ncbi:MAG TPA: hypothetical protein DCY12_07430, partial [Candidatus Atribacteria bacterium]|nr:hypothetical protein [Candidatus Atribacteria bacterium]
GGIIHHPGRAFQTGKRKERFGNYLSTEEEQELSPAPTGLAEETVKGVFLSLKKGMSGLEETSNVFLSKDQEKDHLEDVFDWEPFHFPNGTFLEELVHFELLYKGGKHG